MSNTYDHQKAVTQIDSAVQSDWRATRWASVHTGTVLSLDADINVFGPSDRLVFHGPADQYIDDIRAEADRQNDYLAELELDRPEGW